MTVEFTALQQQIDKKQAAYDKLQDARRKQERIEEFEREQGRMNDQTREAARQLKDLGFEEEDLQGTLADPNADEEEREHATNRLDEIAGDKEHWKTMGEEAVKRLAEMVSERAQMEKDEAAAKAEGEKAEREERKWRIEQA